MAWVILFVPAYSKWLGRTAQTIRGFSNHCRLPVFVIPHPEHVSARRRSGGCRWTATRSGLASARRAAIVGMLWLGRSRDVLKLVSWCCCWLALSGCGSRAPTNFQPQSRLLNPRCGFWFHSFTFESYYLQVKSWRGVRLTSAVCDDVRRQQYSVALFGSLI